MKKYYIALFFICVACTIPYIKSDLFINQYDDTYITYRYAINFAEGNGLVFNAGERTDAASSFLYTMLLSFFYAIGFKNLEIVASVVGFISLYTSALYTYKFSIELSSSKITAFIFSSLLVINGFYSGWALSGMESTLFAALTVISLFYIITAPLSVCAFIFVVLSSLTRFEGIFILLPYLMVYYTNGKPRRMLIQAMLAMFIFLFFYEIKFLYYNVFISHAYEMKKIASYYRSNPIYLIKLWCVFVSGVVLLALFTMIRKKYFCVLLYFISVYVVLLLGPYSDWGRYSIFLLPIVYAFAAPSFDFIYTNSCSCKKVYILIPLLLSMVLVYQSILGYKYNYLNMKDLSVHQECRRKLGDFINAEIDSGSIIISSDIGAIAYVAKNNKFVDLMGLTSYDVLNNYKIGKNFDDILLNKGVCYVADTNVDGNYFERFLSSFGITNKKINYNISLEPLYLCSVKKELVFSVNKVLRTPQ